MPSSKVTEAVMLMNGRKGTNSAQKNQLLFERFGINYNDIPERMRKGSVIVREEVQDSLCSLPSSTNALQQGCQGEYVGRGRQRERETEEGHGLALRPDQGRLLEGTTVYHVRVIDVGLLGEKEIFGTRTGLRAPSFKCEGLGL